MYIVQEEVFKGRVAWDNFLIIPSLPGWKTRILSFQIFVEN